WINSASFFGNKTSTDQLNEAFYSSSISLNSLVNLLSFFSIVVRSVSGLIRILCRGFALSSICDYALKS
ncbi:unnamed protein product, partial [Arabidopsis halleri]